MNKQEAVKGIEDEKILGFTTYEDERYNEGLITALSYVEAIDEPEKPVVPQFVADWYEDNKYTFEYSIVKLIEDSSNNAIEDDNLRLWFGYDLDNDKPIETLVNMHQFGYRVYKEKLYTVELPNPNGNGYCKTYLAKNDEGKVELFTWSDYTSIEFADDWKLEENAQLTEEEIKKDFDWAWQFAEEVKE